MTYKDKYIARDNAYGNNIGDILKNSTISKINDSFKDSPFYRQLSIDGVNTDTRVVTTDKYNQRNLLFKPSTVVQMGSYVTIDGDSWLVSDFFHNDIYPKATILLCNTVLRWLDDDGYEKNYSCVFESPSRLQMGMAEDRTMILPDGKRRVSIKKDDYTTKIKRLKRFILDNDAYKVTDVDSTTLMGITILSLQEDTIGASDNMEKGIADYEGNVANYTIAITNGETFSIRANQTLQLFAEVKNNGVLVTKPVVWSVSDPAIATVDQSGILTAKANGTVVVTVKLGIDNAVIDTATVNVEFSTANNYSIELDSSLDVLVNTSKTFTAIVKNNNVVDSSRRVYWYFYADNGIDQPSAATVTFNSSTQFTLKGVKVGNVRVKAVLVGSSPQLEQTFRIKIESLVG